jgi:hypothetical protein
VTFDEATGIARNAADAGYRVDLVIDGRTGFADVQVRLPTFSEGLPGLLSFAAALNLKVVVAGDVGSFALLPIADIGPL